MIWDENWGNTGIFFDDEKVAKEFCELKNNRYRIGSEAHYNYLVKSMDFYNSMEDYKISQKKYYKHELKVAIKGLKESIEEIESNNFYFYVDLDDGSCNGYHISCNLKKFEEILNNFREEHYTVRTFSSEYYDTETIYLSKKDLPKIKKAYKEAKKELNHMKTTLIKYQKEFVELCGSEKQTAKKAEEKELTK